MKYLTALTILLTAATIVAHDYVPGPAQSQPILLKGGDLYTISDGVLETTDLLFIDGRITAIGKELTAPADCRVIDITGRRVYPGLIAPLSTLGLVEIGEVRATLDLSEVGRVHPEVQGHIAYNTDSEIIPTVRSNGITTALVVPRGGVISGRSSLMNLDGWNWEDAAEKLNLGLHVNWPQERIITAWWMEKTPEEQKEDNAKNRKELTEAFEAARSYYVAKQADPGLTVDARWEAMLPLFGGEMKLFIHANEYRQIENAVAFAATNNFPMVLVGGREAYRLTDLLVAQSVPVVLERTHLTPLRQDDDYDISYRAPKLLSDAGVTFCFSSGAGATGTMNLPFQAGQAVAFGLGRETALKSLTLTTAEILGVDSDLGSLEVGKKATLIVAEGDVLDVLTNRVVMEFIEGREVDLDNRHRELYRKYRARGQQQPATSETE